MSEKVVLVTDLPYTSAHEPFLQSLVDRGVTLFCAFGRDCSNWETGMDFVCIGEDGSGAHFVMTTSHPDEPLEDVINMAELWHVDGDSSVEVIRL